MRRRTFLFFIAIIMTTFFFSMPALRAEDGRPIAFLENNSFDFGRVYEGNEVIHDFIIKNTGLTDLEIITVHSG